MRTTSHHLTRSIAIALVAGAATAPAAAAQQVMPMPDTRDAARQSAAADNPYSRAFGGTRDALAELVTPIERRQDLRSPDTRDAAEGRGMETAPFVDVVEVAQPSGFDWSDAGLGAAAGIGFVLVGAGAAIAAVRLRRRPVGV